MGKQRYFHHRPVGALLVAFAASIQGIERLAPQNRSSRRVMNLLNHVLDRMEVETPELTRSDKRELKKLRSQLQDAVSNAPAMWANFPGPGGLIH